jgi:repressor LexA
LTIGERLRKLRLKKGLTLEEVSKQLKTSKVTMHKYEVGVITNIPINKIKQLAGIYNVSPAYIMGWEEESPLIKMEYKKQIPILGDIAAGEAVFADQNIEGWMWTDKTCHDYALRVKGDSMINACILDNSLVVVDKDAVIDNGDIVVALIDGENATVKRFYQYGDKVILKPENPNLKEKEFSAKDVRLLGKVKQVVLKVK